MMIFALVIPEHFSYAAGGESLTADLHRFPAAFPKKSFEFFYFIKPRETERYFFIRADFSRRDDRVFRQMVKDFAARQNFNVLNDSDGYRLARRLDINSFC